MGEWTKDDKLEKVKVTIEIPKNTVAIVVNTLSNNGNKISMTNDQYDTNDVKKLIEDSEKMGE